MLAAGWFEFLRRWSGSAAPSLPSLPTIPSLNAIQFCTPEENWKRRKERKEGRAVVVVHAAVLQFWRHLHFACQHACRYTPFTFIATLLEKLPHCHFPGFHYSPFAAVTTHATCVEARTTVSMRSVPIAVYYLTATVRFTTTTTVSLPAVYYTTFDLLPPQASSCRAFFYYSFSRTSNALAFPMLTDIPPTTAATPAVSLRGTFTTTPHPTLFFPLVATHRSRSYYLHRSYATTLPFILPAHVGRLRHPPTFPRYLPSYLPLPLDMRFLFCRLPLPADGLPSTTVLPAFVPPHTVCLHPEEEPASCCAVHILLNCCLHTWT